MSASQRTSGQRRRAPEHSIAERTQVRNVLKALQHALRSIPQYGKASPATARAVGSLRESLRVVWKAHGNLTLFFTEEAMSAAAGSVNIPVRAESGRSPSQFQGLRNAGFHSVSFFRGFENEELQRFLELVSSEVTPTSLEDLATALWFEEFNHLEFTLQEAREAREAREAPEAPEAVAEALAGDPQLTTHAAEWVGAPDDPPPIPAALLTHPLSSSELQLTSQETHHLQELIAEEARRPVCFDVLGALLDSLQEDDEPLRTEILSQLGTLLPLLLKRGYLRETSALLLELRGLSEATQAFGPGFCTAVQRTLSTFERSSVVAGYLKGLETGEVVPDLEALADFTGSLGHASTKTLVRIAERTKAKPIAALFQGACERAVEADPHLLLDLLRSNDDMVARGALKLVTASRSDDAVREVIRLLRHRDARMRLAAAKSLLNVGREEALQALMGALDDDNEDVRQTCAWALSTWQYEPAFEAIQGILERSLPQGMALTEQLTYFDAYAQLGGEQAVPLLAELLNARHLFRPRYETDRRACAARALGQIPGREARQALEKARDDRDPKVKRVVMRQLREAKS